MKRFFALGVVLAGITISACSKKADGTGSSTNNNNNNNTQQGNYTGSRFTIAQAERLGASWVELNPDTVYSSYTSASKLFKPIPAGFENKIVSFYLPQGYMVTFAANDDGTGESITVVAKDNALKCNLPTRMRNNISYIRCIAISNPDKKGVGFTNDTTVRTFNNGWYYGWSIDKPSFTTTNQQFVPMTWGKWTCTDEWANYLVERKDVDHLLSFNEPDNSSQSNIPIIDTAVQRYKIMQKSGLRLGSPVTEQDNTFGSGKWLTNFMARAQAQQLRIDFIAVHWYDWGNQTNNAATDSLTAERVFSRFVTFMERVRQAYPSLPIWVTEYNANINRTSDVVHRYFMKLSTEWMNSTNYVERYAYFFPTTVPAINPDKTLTAAGAYWKSLPSTKSLAGNIINDCTTF